MNKLISILFILINLFSCSLAQNDNKEEVILSQNLNIIISAINNKDSELFVSMVDYKTMYKLSWLIPIDSNVVITPKQYSKYIKSIWKSSKNQTITKSNKNKIIMNIKNNYSTIIYNEKIFFFRKKANNWLLFYFAPISLEIFTKNDEILTEYQVFKKLIIYDEKQSQILNNLLH